MGILFSRQNVRAEGLALTLTSNNAYRYPLKTGNYFASHFIMGGERFETVQPEAYLFGENMDLNFLGGKPTPFPYAAPQPNEPVRTLRSLINVRKESLRFVKAPEPSGSEGQREEESSNTQYNIEFTFDSDVKCSISISYFCTEEITPDGVVYAPQDTSLNSETYHYKKGVNQQFNQISHCFDPSKYPEEMLNYQFEDDVIPILIQCVSDEGEEHHQAHIVFAVVEKNGDATYSLKPLKQKLYVDGLCYLLQEIYGIENKNIYQVKDTTDEDTEDNASECVICMSDTRDTLILPCRHLCLCSACADSLRYQANNCPICRAPFRALLQIRAVRKSKDAPLQSVSHDGDNQSSQDIPPGFEPMPLIEALNGPVQTMPAFPPNMAPLSEASVPFSNSPDMQQKQHLESSSAQPNNSVSCGKVGSKEKLNEGKDVSVLSEVVVGTLVSPGRDEHKVEPLSSSHDDVRRHTKGYRMPAPEKMRLLTNSVQLINEVGAPKQEKEDGIGETRSLLEDSCNTDNCHAAVASFSKPTRSCTKGSSVSLSTPHSLHLSDKSNKDTSPGGDDSDYYTPEDPDTSVFIDQGTDTGLDTPLSVDTISCTDVSLSHRKNDHTTRKQKHSKDHDNPSDHEIQNAQEKLTNPVKCDNCAESCSHLSSNCGTVATHLESHRSLSGTSASNSNNYSSGDSFGSTSSSHVLLQHQNCETLPG